MKKFFLLVVMGNGLTAMYYSKELRELDAELLARFGQHSVNSPIPEPSEIDSDSQEEIVLQEIDHSHKPESPAHPISNIRNEQKVEIAIEHIKKAMPLIRKSGASKHPSSAQKSKGKKELIKICALCSKQFASNKELENHHDRNHRKIADQKCTKCAKSYTCKSSLQLHFRRKHTTPQFKCPKALCRAKFAIRGDLNQHIKRHPIKNKIVDAEDLACEDDSDDTIDQTNLQAKKLKFHVVGIGSKR